MSDSGSVGATEDGSIRRESHSMPENTEVLNHDSVPRGLGTPQTIPKVSPVVMSGKKMGKTETGKKTGKNIGHSVEITSEGGGSNGEGVVKGDSEAGAVVIDKGEEGSGETKVGGVWKEEEGCPGLRWGGMRFS